MACKLLKHLIYITIIDYLDANRILTDYQHGVRQRRSCESQLIETVRDIADSLDQSSQEDAVLVNFSKAFDKIDNATRFYRKCAQ